MKSNTSSAAFVVVVWRDTSTTRGFYFPSDVVRRYARRAPAERFAAAHPDKGYVVRSTDYVQEVNNA